MSVLFRYPRSVSRPIPHYLWYTLSAARTVSDAPCLSAHRAAPHSSSPGRRYGGSPKAYNAGKFHQLPNTSLLPQPRSLASWKSYTARKQGFQAQMSRNSGF